MKKSLTVILTFQLLAFFSNVNAAQRRTTTPFKNTSTAARASTAKEENIRPSVAKVESARKNVDVQRAESTDWKKATNDSTLKSADKIRTGRSATARLRLEDGTKVLLLQNSQAEMESLTSVQKTIKLIKGRVRAIVKGMKTPGGFKIKTPIGVASVRGTEFEVEFHEDRQEMEIDVLQGQVGVSKLGDMSDEVVVNPGESLRFGADGEIGDPVRSGAIPLDSNEVRAELTNDKVKESVIALAAEELKNADYQTGKSLIDVDGYRVRVDEYITRPSATQFKLVALNERDHRFDYFTYTGTFNQPLPDDLSIALKEVGGKLDPTGTTPPDYYLTNYEMLMSNTVDHINDVGSGGHPVKIELINNGTQYLLTDPITSTTRTIDVVTDLGGGSYSVYNPIRDTFTPPISAQKAEEAKKIGILDPLTDTYRDLTETDTYWKTRFNNSSYSINDVVKTSFSPLSGVTNILAVDRDGDFDMEPIFIASEFPDGQDLLHNKLSLLYTDDQNVQTFAEFDNYIIDDEGHTVSANTFDGISSSAEYQNQLATYNYQTKITASEMADQINLVIDPRIGIISGLIQ